MKEKPAPKAVMKAIGKGLLALLIIAGIAEITLYRKKGFHLVRADGSFAESVALSFPFETDCVLVEISSKARETPYSRFLNPDSDVKGDRHSWFTLRSNYYGSVSGSLIFAPQVKPGSHFWPVAHAEPDVVHAFLHSSQSEDPEFRSRLLDYFRNLPASAGGDFAQKTRAEFEMWLLAQRCGIDSTVLYDADQVVRNLPTPTPTPQ